MTFLLSKGAALTRVDKNGLTCFLHAVQEGYTQLAEVILKRDHTQIYQRTKQSRCCVHLAVINRQKALLLMLLRNGGSKYTNAIDCNNRSPLHYAAVLGDSEVGSSSIEAYVLTFQNVFSFCHYSTIFRSKQIKVGPHLTYPIFPRSGHSYPPQTR